MLIACNYSTEEIARIVGADTLGFLLLEDVKKIAEGACAKGYCMACFDGNYPTEEPEKYVSKFDNKISESEKEQ